MLEKLKEELEKIKESDSPHIWTNTEEYHSLTSKKSCIIISTSDYMVYRLDSFFEQKDFEKVKELYTISSAYNFRIEKPIMSEVIILNSIPFLYAVYQRPEFGEDYSYDIGIKSVDTDYFIEFVDSSTPLLCGLMEIGKNFNTGLPVGMIGPGKRLRDSQGYFFYDLVKWYSPHNTYIEKNIEDLLYQIDFSNITNGNIINKNIVQQYMSVTWKNI